MYTLNGYTVIGEAENRKTVCESNPWFFVRKVLISSGDDSDKDIRPGAALFYNSKELIKDVPIFAVPVEHENEITSEADTLFGMAETTGILSYSEDKLEKFVELAHKLHDIDIDFVECEATDSQGYTAEGTVVYEGQEYYVYSSAKTGIKQ